MIRQDDKMPFLAHLDELRTRLITVAKAYVVAFLICYFFMEEIFDVLSAPLMRVMGTSKLIYTGLPEAFFTYLKVAALAAFGLCSPVIFHQFWGFVAPGLYQKERRILLPVIFLSTLFFLGGALFGYFIVFPFVFQFFLGFANETIQAMPSMKEYLSFATKMLLAFGIAFEMPLVITVMSRMGLLTVEGLKRNRKYFILSFFIAGAILTPPDVISQVMLAVPLMLLFELSILGARIFARKPLDADLEAADAEAEQTEKDKKGGKTDDHE